jgi:hypothetical protein
MLIEVLLTMGKGYSLVNMHTASLQSYQKANNVSNKLLSSAHPLTSKLLILTAKEHRFLGLLCYYRIFFLCIIYVEEYDDSLTLLKDALSKSYSIYGSNSLFINLLIFNSSLVLLVLNQGKFILKLQKLASLKKIIFWV